VLARLNHSKTQLVSYYYTRLRRCALDWIHVQGRRRVASPPSEILGKTDEGSYFSQGKNNAVECGTSLQSPKFGTWRHYDSFVDFWWRWCLSSESIVHQWAQSSVVSPSACYVIWSTWWTLSIKSKTTWYTWFTTWGKWPTLLDNWGGNRYLVVICRWDVSECCCSLAWLMHLSF
jgi:hypothetical protein